MRRETFGVVFLLLCSSASVSELVRDLLCNEEMSGHQQQVAPSSQPHSHLEACFTFSLSSGSNDLCRHARHEENNLDVEDEEEDPS